MTTIISNILYYQAFRLLMFFFSSTKAIEACAHEFQMQTVNNTENTIEIAAKKSNK